MAFPALPIVATTSAPSPPAPGGAMYGHRFARERAQGLGRVSGRHHPARREVVEPRIEVLGRGTALHEHPSPAIGRGRRVWLVADAGRDAGRMVEAPGVTPAVSTYRKGGGDHRADLFLPAAV